MSNNKLSGRNTTKSKREKNREEAMSHSKIGAEEPSEDAMKLVSDYVEGNMEIVDALEIVIEKYRSMELKNF